MDNCLFCKIIRREIPAGIVYEDENVLAFKDIHPQKPVHVLIVPKKHIEDFTDLDSQTCSILLPVVQKLVKENNLMGKGYRVEVNGGGLQDVNHLHIHLLGPFKNI